MINPLHLVNLPARTQTDHTFALVLSDTFLIPTGRLVEISTSAIRDNTCALTNASIHPVPTIAVVPRDLIIPMTNA